MEIEMDWEVGGILSCTGTCRTMYLHSQKDVDEQVAAAASDEGRRGRREENSDLYNQGEQRLSCGPLSRTRMRRTSEPLTGMVA